MTSKAPQIFSRRQVLAGVSLLALAPGVQAGAPFRRDRAGRLVVPVRLNGRGPFQFALDTGAEMSAISNFLATELRVLASLARFVSVTGVIGIATVPLITLDAVECDDLSCARQDAVVLDDAQLSGSDGLLGADILRHGVLTLDFPQGRFALGATATSLGQRNIVKVRLARRFASLLAASCRIDNVRATAIIDCGAPHSVGNLTLLRSLGLGTTSDAAADAVVVDANGNRMPARLGDAPAIAIGKSVVRATQLRFADLPLFVRWGLATRPALLLGLDRLSQLGWVQIDYPASVMRIAT